MLQIVNFSDATRGLNQISLEKSTPYKSSSPSSLMSSKVLSPKSLKSRKATVIKSLKPLPKMMNSKSQKKSLFQSRKGGKVYKTELETWNATAAHDIVNGFWIKHDAVCFITTCRQSDLYMLELYKFPKVLPKKIEAATPVSKIQLFKSKKNVFIDVIKSDQCRFISILVEENERLYGEHGDACMGYEFHQHMSGLKRKMTLYLLDADRVAANLKLADGIQKVTKESLGDIKHYQILRKFQQFSFDMFSTATKHAYRPNLLLLYQFDT